MGKNDIFQNIKKKIEKREFNSAIKDLTKISTSKKSSKKDKSYANYLIGFINNNYFYDDKDTEQGKNALIKCIESEFPIPEAFSILSSLEDDKNIAINCLKKGKSLFPDSPTIYRSLLNCPISKADCLTYINEVKKREIKDFYLFNQILEYLISQHLWEETKYFTKIIIDSPNVEIEKKLTYRVIEAFSYVLSNIKEDIKIAEQKLLEIISEDIANKLHYSHYMAIILCYIKKNDKKNLVHYINNFSINEKLFDFGFWDGSPVTIDFQQEYEMIFSEAIKLFNNNKRIKNKIKAIRASYLLHTSNEGFIRGNKIHIKDLKKQYEIEPHNISIVKIILRSQLYFKLNYDAFETYMGIDSYDIIKLESHKGIVQYASNADFQKIYTYLLEYIKNSNHFHKYFVNDIYDEVIFRLWEEKTEDKFSEIVKLSQLFKWNYQKESLCLFEIAYAYAECDLTNDAQTIYEFILKKEPNNTAVLNNLGVIYNSNKQYEKALEFYKRANELEPQKELYINNIKSTEKSIEEQIKNIKKQEDDRIKKIAKNINIGYFESIGYDDNLKLSFNKIKDNKLRDTLLKDLNECVICLAAEQSKAFAVMCGSIIEAILYWSLTEQNIKKYEIKNKSKKITEMGISDLLFVANQEKLIQSSTFHFCHGLKDYRNLVHPSRDISSDFERSEEENIIIWGLLKKIIKDILK